MAKNTLDKRFLRMGQGRGHFSARSGIRYNLRTIAHFFVEGPFMRDGQKHYIVLEEYLKPRDPIKEWSTPSRTYINLCQREEIATNLEVHHSRRKAEQIAYIHTLHAIANEINYCKDNHIRYYFNDTSKLGKELKPKRKSN